MDYVQRYYPRIIGSAAYRYFFSANEVYVRAFQNDNYLNIIDPIRTFLKKEWNIVKNDAKVSLRQKVRFILMMYAPRMYRELWKFVKR